MKLTNLKVFFLLNCRNSKRNCHREKDSPRKNHYSRYYNFRSKRRTMIKYFKIATQTKTGKNKLRNLSKEYSGWRITFWTLRYSWWKMLTSYSNNKLLSLLTNLTREFSQFYQKNQKRKRMMKSVSSRRFKTKSSSLAQSCREFQSSKLKDMLHYRAPESLMLNFRLMLNLTAF